MSCQTCVAVAPLCGQCHDCGRKSQMIPCKQCRTPLPGDIQGTLYCYRCGVKQDGRDFVPATGKYPSPVQLPKSYCNRLLKRIPILSRLSENDRHLLTEQFELQTFPENKYIIRQGDPPNGLFFLVEGTARVLRHSAPNDQVAPVEIGLLSPGDYFGETALLTNELRTASIVASSSCTTLYLSRDKFHTFFGRDKLNLPFAQRRGAVTSEATSRPPSAHKAGVPAALMSESSPSSPSAVGVRELTHVHSWLDAVMSLDSTIKRPMRQPLPMVTHTRSTLLDVLSQCPLFQRLEVESRVALVHSMYSVAIPAGACVIKQGEVGSKLYVVASGTFDVFVESPVHEVDEQKEGDMHDASVRGVPVAVLAVGRLFGELAILHNSPRNATVIAREDAVVWVLERVTFTSIVRAHGTTKLTTYLGLMRKVDFLAPLTEYERQKIAGAVEEVFYPANTAIFYEGDEGDAMYIVFEGHVSVTQRDASGRDVPLQQLGAGDYFGELALVFSQPRAATVTAVQDTKCLKLDKAIFKIMLGPVVDYLAKRAQGYRQSSAAIAAVGTMVAAASTTGGVAAPVASAAVDARPAESFGPASRTPLALVGDGSSPVAASGAAAAVEPRAVQLEELEGVAVLGKGSFGFVQLVKDKAGTLYALKSLHKQQVVQTQQKEHVINEKYILSHLSHPFVIKLHATYKTQHKIFFLLEPVMGGELFTLLRKRASFSEPWAQFYAASVVQVFQYLHAYSIAYRDLKPENLLLDLQGFIRVCDFGFAKVVGHSERHGLEVTWTLCGTPDYLAPEIVTSRGHNKSVDWWTLGVLIYEMLASYPPFWDNDPINTYNKIAQGAYAFPAHFSPHARSLIAALLDPNPHTRLGCTAAGVQPIQAHPFFAGMDWTALYHKRVSPPYVPVVAHPHDASNFARSDLTDTDVPYVDDGTNWDKDF